MNGDNGIDPTSFLANKLKARPMDSKKFISAGIGLISVMVVWLGTLICMFIKTETAAQFVSLATIVISFVGAITTTILTGQAVFEYKAMATMQTIDTNDKDEKSFNSNMNYDYNQSIVEGSQDKLKPFGQVATHPAGVDK